jgi:hypothetical protein
MEGVVSWAHRIQVIHSFPGLRNFSGSPGKRMEYERLQDEGVDCSSHRMRARICVGSQRSQWSSREDIISSSIPLNEGCSSEKNFILL